jgi:hypothetical protein
MSAKSKIYTIPEKNFLRQAGQGMWIGSVFKDHGRTMRVTAIGKAYKEGTERLIEITAVEVSDGG